MLYILNYTMLSANYISVELEKKRNGYDLFKKIAA